jgi:hypothetical protein
MANDKESPRNQTSMPAAGATASEMSRRDAVQVLAYMPFAAILSWPAVEQERMRSFVDAAMESAKRGAQYVPKFFTAEEFRAARILADMIIPRDDRSGSSSDAGVPEFMDFMMIDRPKDQTWMRTGLAWLDAQASTRLGKPFADATDTQREQILEDIAWPARAPASMAAGVEFFNHFRDLTSSGFWSSRIGVKDLEYIGNQALPDWDGCPPAALAKLGVSYDKFDRKALRLTPE